ncbi:intradiol ring-cleavage dioxygenase [Noviherbaspirillum sp.]|uniref:intradiol ring-cleavage dioxygenase n=1 Tax=Noviherbaspirillum sp. TaxID=1926288 RepID=UPI002FE2587B
MEPDRPSTANRYRRTLLALFGAGFLPGRLHAQPARGTPACILTPQQIEGPYFIDQRLNRSDIRFDPVRGQAKTGAPLHLILRISAVGDPGCTPLAGAVVDIWHCDAGGEYSAVEENRRNPEQSGFLRGYQVTDANGEVRFTTIYPGAYPGRTVHIHVKVRTRSSSGRASEFTSQLYFDDGLTDRVYLQKAYADSRKARQKNSQDGLFQRGGRQLMLVLNEQDDGYRGSFDFGIRI